MGLARLVMSLTPLWIYAERVAGPEAFSPADPAEAVRVERLVDPARRQDILYARHLMRTLIADTYDRQGAGITLQVFDEAPPRVEGMDDVAVSWSRSGPHALAALLPHGRLGVDLEQVKPVRWTAMLDMIATPVERTALERISGEKAALYGFYRLWCAKEALLKWRGTGLRGGAKTVSVPDAFMTGDSDEIIVTDRDNPVHLKALYPAEGIVAALAFSG